jgi:uncharacterized protein YdhG (YjbR/CyaY superfamily)
MSSEEIDRYLATLDEPRRSTLAQLRATIRSIIPDAEEGLAYGAPAYRVRGKAIAGFAAFKTHLSYLPHSGAVLSAIAADISDYKSSKGALQFDVDRPLPDALVRALIDARMREVDDAQR